MLPPDLSEHRKTLKHRSAGAARFLTFSCQGRLPLLGNAKLAGIFADAMVRSLTNHNISLYAWVIMPEHVHLLVQPRTIDTIARTLLQMKQSTAQQAIARWRELDAPILSRLDDGHGSPRFWLKGGGFDRSIRSESELRQTILYIHRNPVERELVGTPQDWPWSSVHWWLANANAQVNCEYPLNLDSWQGFM